MMSHVIRASGFVNKCNLNWSGERPGVRARERRL